MFSFSSTHLDHTQVTAPPALNESEALGHVTFVDDRSVGISQRREKGEGSACRRNEKEEMRLKKSPEGVLDLEKTEIKSHSFNKHKQEK